MLNKQTMQKILITGGDGFIAKHTIRAALNRGYEVVSNVRSINAEGRTDGVQYYIIDNRDKAAMRTIIERVDGVINLAGILGTRVKSLQDLDAFYENNVKGAHSVMKACSTLQVPLVQIAVGNHFEHNWYSNTKTAVERDVMAAAKYLGLIANVVRGLNAYGPEQKVKNTGKIVPTFITQALANEPLTVYGGQDNCSFMDMIYVEDLANILLNVLEGTKVGSTAQLIEAGTGVALSVWEIAELIVKLTGSKSEIQEVPMRTGETIRSVVKAMNPYKYNHTPIEQGLLNTIEYYSK